MNINFKMLINKISCKRISKLFGNYQGKKYDVVSRIKILNKITKASIESYSMLDKYIAKKSTKEICRYSKHRSGIL